MLDIEKQVIELNKDKIEKYQSMVEEMMDDGTMTWAGKFLVSIYDYMWYNHNITEGQIQSIKTIRRKANVWKR